MSTCLARWRSVDQWAVPHSPSHHPHDGGTDATYQKEDSYCMVYEQKHAIQGTLDVMTHYIYKDKYEALKRFEVKEGDFIMSCRGTLCPKNRSDREREGTNQAIH